jgi:endonuclease YncB( thermonuclease family)
VAYRRFALDYVPQEDAARGAQRGIWAGPFDMPEAWRAAHR